MRLFPIPLMLILALSGCVFGGQEGEELTTQSDPAATDGALSGDDDDTDGTDHAVDTGSTDTTPTTSDTGGTTPTGGSTGHTGDTGDAGETTARGSNRR